MRQVIIHAGFHKTATTSIQGTCFRNKEKLENMGIHYPFFSLKDRLITNHSLPFHSVFATHINNTRRQKPLHALVNLENEAANEIYLKQMDTFLSQNYEKIIISGESISALDPGEFQELKKKIEHYDYQVRVIVFVRSPFSFMTSMVQERIKSDHYDESSNGKSLMEKIDNISSVFPDAEFYPFKQACSHEYGPVGFFLETVGVDNYRTFEFLRGNDSFSNEAVRLICYINEQCPTYVDKKINPLRTFDDIQIFHLIEGKKFQLNDRELDRFQATVNRENEYLLDKLGAEFCDRIVNSEYKEESQWSDEQIEQLKCAVSKVSDHLKSIVYDYCANVISLDPEQIFDVFSEAPLNSSTNFQQTSKERGMAGMKAIEKAKASFETGNKLQEEGNLEESIVSYQQAIKIKPDYAQPLFKLAEIYESQENWREAVKCYRRTIGLKSNNYTAHLKLAKVLIKQNKIYGAIASYYEAIELKPDLPARIYKDLGDLLLQDRQDVDHAIAIYQQAAERKSDWGVNFYIKYADILLEKNLLDQAIFYYQKGIKLKNDNPRFYVSLGDALHQKQDLDKAIVCYEKATQLKPDYVSAYKKLGDVYQEREQLDSAVGCYHKSLELNLMLIIFIAA